MEGLIRVPAICIYWYDTIYYLLLESLGQIKCITSVVFREIFFKYIHIMAIVR
jgi:hypothetical protein